MERYSPEVDKFIREYVLPKLNLTDYNYENISEVLEYIANEYEGPLASAEEYGDILSDEEKYLLDISTKAVTEINTRYDWDKIERYSPEVDKFIREYVLPRLNLSDYDFDNVELIERYISKDIKGMIESRRANGDTLNEEDDMLLDISTKAVTEMTTRYDWKWIKD